MNELQKERMEAKYTTIRSKIFVGSKRMNRVMGKKCQSNTGSYIEYIVTVCAKHMELKKVEMRCTKCNISAITE